MVHRCPKSEPALRKRLAAWVDKLSTLPAKQVNAREAAAISAAVHGASPQQAKAAAYSAAPSW